MDTTCEGCRQLEAECAELRRRLGEGRHTCGKSGPRVSNEEPDRPDGLTTRETEVLDLIAEGLSTREIADRLYLSPNSVKTHTRKLFRKIGVSNRTEAALWALAQGFLAPTAPTR